MRMKTAVVAGSSNILIKDSASSKSSSKSLADWESRSPTVGAIDSESVTASHSPAWMADSVTFVSFETTHVGPSSAVDEESAVS